MCTSNCGFCSFHRLTDGRAIETENQYTWPSLHDLWHRWNIQLLIIQYYDSIIFLWKISHHVKEQWVMCIYFIRLISYHFKWAWSIKLRPFRIMIIFVYTVVTVCFKLLSFRFNFNSLNCRVCKENERNCNCVNNFILFCKTVHKQYLTQR